MVFGLFTYLQIPFFNTKNLRHAGDLNEIHRQIR